MIQWLNWETKIYTFARYRCHQPVEEAATCYVYMCHRVVYCDGGSRECRELNRHVTNTKIEPENEKT